jgi:hypothetical protein
LDFRLCDECPSARHTAPLIRHVRERSRRGGILIRDLDAAPDRLACRRQLIAELFQPGSEIIAVESLATA